MSGQPSHIRMVNDIARQFRTVDEDQAAQAIAAHLRSFWDPRMRERLLADAHAGADLDPLALRACEWLGPPRRS